ncbi:pyrroline-5-carboxylate reductase [Alkalithermobacter thermoalcaliphilus JW-YL-7 = DSM 7308]|uniref:Pyrroline-5-carboxylate reductase n=1 Tax=Alkalithermobacter thermoalcaliphilus JW-YL-7 = DSM 7308 TaxID=1121328 RepID=A0A150FRV1_CLOPD|nr:pyrroline-5-carboxylate reductase [[Clostridium] paradoxum JW-YL-7 = DSM 7308]SHK38163.1 pyrroline-5-carboxylate reductase [[Clostridium] paradoxum JW-YL-7 = DSM 7308]
MNKKIGFIGCGNMAQAIIGGLITSDLISFDNIIASDIDSEKLKTTKDKYNILTTNNNVDVATFSDIIFLSVKPDKYKLVIKKIKDFVKDDAIIVTIAAGIDISFTEKCFQRKIKVVRTMPNTPSLVKEGMSAISFNDLLDDNEKELILKLFESFGKAEVIDESLMDIIPSISGSSPAYVYMLIEALADGAVLKGLPRDKAYKLAAQSVLGAAKMVLETNEHPAVLKDKVCSPGGTTIEAIYELEKRGFRSAIISCMEKCTQKALSMSKNM